jgi:hypothetical protein
MRLLSQIFGIAICLALIASSGACAQEPPTADIRTLMEQLGDPKPAHPGNFHEIVKLARKDPEARKIYGAETAEIDSRA